MKDKKWSERIESEVGKALVFGIAGIFWVPRVLVVEKGRGGCRGERKVKT